MRNNSEMAAVIIGSLGGFSRQTQISCKLRRSLGRAGIIEVTPSSGRFGVLDGDGCGGSKE